MALCSMFSTVDNKVSHLCKKRQYFKAVKSIKDMRKCGFAKNLYSRDYLGQAEDAGKCKQYIDTFFA